ncbi:MAG: MATE family efflux transporter [Opitutus sp.]|nr:MATE family efflux transporter [Opitutus sp.]
MTHAPEFLRELRATLTLAFPIVVGQVGQTLMGITDSVMIGRVGKVPLAAAAFANGICNMVFIVGLGLLLPVAVLTARAHGAREPRECGEYLRHGVALAAGVGAATLLLLLPLGTQLHRFGQPAEVLAEIGPYYVLLTLSLLPAYFFQVFKQYSEALGRPWPPMAILLGCVVLNGGLNWVFIYGHLGFPAWGLAGAGLATLIARLLACLILWRWLARMPGVRAEWPAGTGATPPWFARLGVDRLREMLRIGVPAAGQWMFEVGAFTAAAVMMGWIGTVSLAAHQIALSCAAFTFMFPLGLSSAVAVRLSKTLGEGRREALRPIGFGALAAGFAVMTCFGLAFAFGGTWLARGFTAEADVVALAARLLVVAGLFQILDGGQVVGAGALRGLHDVKIPTAITFVAYWVLALPGGYLLAFHTPLGGVGVWTGLAAGLGFAALLLGWRFHRLTGRRAP